MSHEVRAPEFKWPLYLGVVGFTAGFLGPLIFVPEANQGPLVGILISGPAGLLLGSVLLAACTIRGVSARSQWRLLKGTAIIGGLVVILCVQPGPVLRGYVMELEVESCARPIESERSIIDHWSARIADVTWAAARPGWQQDMHDALRAAPGVILTVKVKRQVSIWEKRKPWNRGRLFATAGRNAPEESAFYDSSGTCAGLPVGHSLRAFEEYDLNGPIQPPAQWPPMGLEAIIHVSPIVPVPAQFASVEAG